MVYFFLLFFLLHTSTDLCQEYETYFQEFPQAINFHILNYVISNTTKAKHKIAKISNVKPFDELCAWEWSDTEHPRPLRIESAILASTEINTKNIAGILKRADQLKDEKKKQECYNALNVADPWYMHFYNALTCGSCTLCSCKTADKLHAEHVKSYENLVRKKYGIEALDEEKIKTMYNFNSYVEKKKNAQCFVPLCLGGTFLSFVCFPCLIVSLSAQLYENYCCSCCVRCCRECDEVSFAH
ncbi:MAG: hypothetical protein AB7R69_04805 [Candidatus Babeliales bacterium]